MLSKLLETSDRLERAAKMRAYIQVLLEANPRSLQEVLAMESAIIQRVIRESDWFVKEQKIWFAQELENWQKILDAEHQKAEQEHQKAEQEHQKAERERQQERQAVLRYLQEIGMSAEQQEEVQRRMREATEKGPEDLDSRS